MGIITNFTAKNKPFNVSWKRYYTERNITVPPNKIFASNTSFFTIGSCFANELRAALDRRGFQTFPKPSPDIHRYFPDNLKRPPAWGPWDDLVALQFYNTFSLRQEFEKAFGIWSQAPEDYYAIDTEKEVQFWDPYRRSVYAESPVALQTINTALDNSMRRGIFEADVAVVTLGLIEIFRRKDNGKVICQYNRHFTPYVQFEASDYAANLANIESMCEMYFDRFPHKHMIITTSPVALAQTFREMDVVVANTESKSLLRTVCGEICRRFPNAHYWPSFEICMNHDDSFQPDLRHVRRERVDSIIESFLLSHIRED